MTGFSYPAPNLVVPLDYDAHLSARIAEYLENWNAYRQAHPDQLLPDFDEAALKANPIVIALGAAAYGDLYLAARSNDVARSAVLVDFARDDDLDLHGQATTLPGFPTGISRHPGETDAQFAARIIEARTGSSAAGPDEWWLSHARAADQRVRSIGLDYRGLGILDVYLLASDNGGIADAAMVEAVGARLSRPDIRPRNVQPRVHAAVIESVNIIADVWLTPEAADSRLDDLKVQARRRHLAEQALDVDLTHHYLRRLLDAGDVYDIDFVEPSQDRLASPERAYALGTLTLRLAGRAR